MGALTSKPYAFNARPWELRSFESIDFFDSIGSSIRLDLRGLTLMRVLPYINESINEEWITDKVRFSYDGLKYQRLVVPLQRVQKKFVKISWSYFYCQLANSLMKKRLASGVDLLVGQFVDSRSFLSTLMLLKTIKSIRNDSSRISVVHRELLNFPSQFKYRSSYANFKWASLDGKKNLLLIDTNLRMESPLINLKVRRAVLSFGLNVYSFGFQSDFLYPVYNLGLTTYSLIRFFEGRHALSRIVMNSLKPELVFFYSYLTMQLGKGELLNMFFKVARRLSLFSLNHYYLLHSISSFGLFDLVGKSLSDKISLDKRGLLWCMSEDEVCFDENNYDIVVYAGHHGDRNALRASFLVPSFAPFEKANHYINVLGMNRNSSFVINGPHLAVSEEFFARTFSSYLNSLLFLNRPAYFSEKVSMFSVMSQFGFLSSTYQGASINTIFCDKETRDYSESVVKNEISFDRSLSYYADNSIVRASHVMALAQSRFKRYKTNFHS